MYICTAKKKTAESETRPEGMSHIFSLCWDRRKIRTGNRVSMIGKLLEFFFLREILRDCQVIKTLYWHLVVFGYLAV